MRTIDLTGKNAVVTGAGQGLGKQIALSLAESGANVWIADIVSENAEQTSKEISALGRKSNWSKVDVSKQSEVDTMVDTAAAKLGSLDIMVNVAGIFSYDTIENITEEKIEKITKINLFGTVYGCKAAVRNMRKHGKGGSIVNIASIAARAGDPRFPFYHMTKASVLNYNKSLAKTVAAEGIRCNAVCPGLIRTPMLQERMLKEAHTTSTDVDEYWLAYVKRVIPMGFAQTPENIADAVLFFCSDLSSCITGQALNVCGGLRMS